MAEPQTIFIGWFADSISALRKVLAANNIDENRVADARSISQANMPGRHCVLLEHYPLQEKENALLQKLRLHTIDVYCSLQEPLMLQFGGERIASLVKMLGIKPGEVIEHPLVDKSIEKARQKLAGKVVIDQTARSQDDWFTKNTGGSLF